MKRGKYWVTPLAHWENERRKIDYDYLVKLRSKNKNVYDKKFMKNSKLERQDEITMLYDDVLIKFLYKNKKNKWKEQKIKISFNFNIEVSYIKIP